MVVGFRVQGSGFSVVGFETSRALEGLCRGVLFDERCRGSSLDLQGFYKLYVSGFWGRVTGEACLANIKLAHPHKMLNARASAALQLPPRGAFWFQHCRQLFQASGTISCSTSWTPRSQVCGSMFIASQRLGLRV